MSTAHNRVAEDNLLHGFFSLNPWSTSQRKAVADMNTHVQAERISLYQRTIHHPPEILTQRISPAFVFRTLCRTTNRHQVTAAQPYVLHSLQVSTNASL